MEEIPGKYSDVLPEKVLKRFIKDGKIKEDELAKHLNKVLISLESLLPSNLVKRKLKQEKNTHELLKGTMMFADIAGFTSMSEKLSRMGQQGAEEVTGIINRFFGPLLEIIFHWDGILYRFGGDALIAFFPENHIPSEIRAVYAASDSLAFVEKNGAIKVRGVGRFSIGMHIALAKGTGYFYDLGNDFALVGNLSNRIYKIGNMAQRGEILFEHSMWSKLQGLVTFKKKSPNVYKLTGLREKWSYVSNKPRISSGRVKNLDTLIEHIRVLKPYFPEWLFKRVITKPDFSSKDGEHRKLSVVFINFWGIPYNQQSGEGYHKIREFYSKVRETAERYGGYINKIDIGKKGDRLLVLFGYPSAMENDERRACLFMDELLNDREIRKLNIDFKAGINSGRAFAGTVGSKIRREITVIGDTVNVSARIAAKAKSLTTLVSEKVYEKASPYFEFKKQNPVKLKGKRNPVILFRLRKKKIIHRARIRKWLSESAVMVGRDREMQKALKLMDKVQSNKGQILGIRGEAGVGKSRFTRELTKELQKRNFKILSGGCEAYKSALSYYPWIEILNSLFSITPTDTVDKRKEKIESYILRAKPKMKDWLPIIGEIMGITFPETSLTKFLDAKLKKQRAFDIIFDLLKHESKNAPVSIILEDLHWADSVSTELVNYIGRNIQDKPILLMLVFRPLKKKEEFMEKTYYTEFSLTELSRSNTISLVENLLNIRSFPEEFKKLIISKSQGNPFYIEEIVKSLIETGFIREERGKWKFKGDFRKITLPDTVEGIILSRIDQLDFTTKEILQIASVLGREFDAFLLKGIYQDEDMLNEALKTLGLLDLIKLEKNEGQVKYFFKHVLTQEVAYSTLSFAKRREIHENVAKLIEHNMKDRIEEFAGLLSHHYFYAEDYEKALVYSFKAGEKAKQAYANYEAIEFYTRAIESYEKLQNRIA